MLSSDDQLRARFFIGDSVQFKYRRRPLSGTLLRTNPKRAVVLVNGQEYTVPYTLLVAVENQSGQDATRISEIMHWAQQQLIAHGLKKWRFRFDQSTRRAGCCNYRDKTISMAFELARSGNETDIRDTILHEIAHALVGRKHNHDAVWKAQAKAIGCSGERTHKLQFATPRWNITCENRCWSHTGQRRNTKLICRKCGSRLVYTPFSLSA